MPVLRSRVGHRRGVRAAPACSLLQGGRQPAYGDVAVDLAAALAAQPATPTASPRTVTTAGGTSQSRISTRPRVGTADSAADGAHARAPAHGRADPLLGAVGEALVLPDRHLGLERVDQGPGGVERLAAVGGRGRARRRRCRRSRACRCGGRRRRRARRTSSATRSQTSRSLSSGGGVGGVLEPGRRPGRRRGRGPGRRTASARRTASSSSAAEHLGDVERGLAEVDQAQRRRESAHGRP